KLRRYGSDCFLDPFNPIPWQTISRALCIVKRYNFVLECLVETESVGFVLKVLVVVVSIVTNCPAIFTIVTFCPPTIQDGQIECSVHSGFHPAGTGSFAGSARGIEPNVNALYQMARHVHVVIIQKDQATAITRALNMAVNFLDQTLARLVGGV